MAALELAEHHIDIEEQSLDGSESAYFSVTDEESFHSHFFSTNNESCDIYSMVCASHDSLFYPNFSGSRDDPRLSCFSDQETTLYSVAAGAEPRRASSVSDCSIKVVEVEGGGISIIQSNSVKGERVCRICHLGLESSREESGAPIHLGCSCKDDLGYAHTRCADAWFNIKGNKTCEICNSVACNVIGPNETTPVVQSFQTDSGTVTQAPTPTPTSVQGLWRGHRFLNLLLACIVFAFVVSWLLHFNVSV